MIHPTAIVDTGAELDSGVEVGPYSIIHNHVEIGKNTKIASHVVIEPYTTIGEDCVISSFACLGGKPQALKFEGEVTSAIIGRKTVIREYVTINRGTAFGGGITEVGENSYLMACSHVAHDCRIGKQVIMANAVALAGHIIVGDYVSIGGLAAVHQFVRIGDYAYIGGKAAVVKDIPPYMIAAGDRAALHGLNRVGLKRAGMEEETLSHLKKAYRIFFRYGLTLHEALQRVKAEVEQIPEVVTLIRFMESSQRGITR